MPKKQHLEWQHVFNSSLIFLSQGRFKGYSGQLTALWLLPATTQQWFCCILLLLYLFLKLPMWQKMCRHVWSFFFFRNKNTHKALWKFHHIKDNGSCTLLYVAEWQFNEAKTRDIKTNYTNEKTILMKKWQKYCHCDYSINLQNSIVLKALLDSTSKTCPSKEESGSLWSDAWQALHLKAL